MELTKLGSSGDPLEGTNVTLLCRHFGPESTRLKWSRMQSNSENPFPLNATDLPEGFKEAAHKMCNWIRFLFIFYIKEWRLQKKWRKWRKKKEQE